MFLCNLKRLGYFRFLCLLIFADLVPTEMIFLKVRLFSSIVEALCKVFNVTGNFVLDSLSFFYNEFFFI